MVDRESQKFRDLWKALGISNDDFIRTTEARHAKTVGSIFEKLLQKGDIYKGHYEDWYCVSCESFWLESELVEGNCPDCGRKVEKLKEESYFFRQSAYEKKLLDFYAANPEFLSPKKRAAEMVNFVKQGLKDVSISRLKETWGIPIPQDSTHTVYVWFDALLNYLTAGEKNWPPDIHMMGKEIFRFHAVLWPALLLALDLPLPKKVFAHGWWTAEGEKMSKSKGNFVDPYALIPEYGVDGLRYFLLREIPFGVDGDFSMASLRARYNAELANNLGNLFSRTLTLIEKNFDGQLSVDPPGDILKGLGDKLKRVREAYDQLAFSEVLEVLGSVVTETNRYIDDHAPWKQVKTDRAGAEKALAECLAVLRWLACAYAPFMPTSADIMWKQTGETYGISSQGREILENPLSGWTRGRKILKGAVLFMRKS
ncbi:MAG: methionine--tRNA ligase [Elusimicrobia bacterium RIFCSPLOWO2_01_FULL_54_10]|nr:MAG: methionine--tRNA ligase [Elusimicrobia bacterium RIFCSPLOWO2_01_FULL_54_10]